MKFLLINSVCDSGNVGKMVRTLSDSLKKEGHEVMIAYGRRKPQRAEDTFSISTKWGLLWHVLMTTFLGRHGLHSKRATKLLIARIEAYQPDIIHLHNLHGYYLDVRTLFDYFANRNFRLVWTLHDCWSFSGSSASFTCHGCKVWEDGCVECNSTEGYPRAIGFKRQRKNFAWKQASFTGVADMTWISASCWLKELADTTFLRKYPGKVVPNGIDTAIFKPQLNPDLVNRYNGKNIILGVADYWEQSNGLFDFVHLASLLDDHYQIVLIGLSAQQIAKLPQNVVGIERTNTVEELVAYYSMAHVLVNPTYEDGFPTTHREALCCHSGVIAYDTGGNKEVAPAPYMNLVAPGDVIALAQAIQDYRKPEVWLDVTVFDNQQFLTKMHAVYFESDESTIA